MIKSRYWKVNVGFNFPVGMLSNVSILGKNVCLVFIIRFHFSSRNILSVRQLSTMLGHSTFNPVFDLYHFYEFERIACALTWSEFRARRCISFHPRRCGPEPCIWKRPPRRVFRSSSGCRMLQPESVASVTKNWTLWATWPANCLATAI